MNIHDLEAVFIQAIGNSRLKNREDLPYEAHRRAGLKAVVEALRDEMLENVAQHGEPVSYGDIHCLFHDILGGAGNDKAGLTIIDETGTVTKEHWDYLSEKTKPYPEHARNHYGTPAADVCEWTGGRGDWFEISCRQNFRLSPFFYKPKGKCEFCGKPISFKEAANGE